MWGSSVISGKIFYRNGSCDLMKIQGQCTFIRNNIVWVGSEWKWSLNTKVCTGVCNNIHFSLDSLES